MARPRHDRRPDDFTTTELAVAASLTGRQMHYLDDAGLLPLGAGTAGMGGSRAHAEHKLTLAAMVGAAHIAGLHLAVAAGVMAAVHDEFRTSKGKMFSNLGAFLFRPFHDKSGHLPWQKLDGDETVERDFWLHHYLRTRSTVYRPDTALPADAVIEIADREWVFTTNAHTAFGSNPSLGSAVIFPPEPFGRIEGFANPEHARLITFADEVGPLVDEAGQPRWQPMHDRYMAARRNARGLLSINVSLAIRTGLDRLYDWRATR